MIVLSDSVQQISRTAGAGDYSLDGIVTNAGVLPFAGRVTVGKKCRYKVQQLGTTTFEINEGVFDGDSLTRERLVLSSTGAPINWPDGSDKIVTLVAIAEDFGPEGGQHCFAVSTGVVVSSACAVLAASFDVPISALKSGTEVYLKLHADAADAATLTVNGTFGPWPIKVGGITRAIAKGDAPINSIARLVFDDVANQWHLLNPVDASLRAAQTFTGTQTFTNAKMVKQDLVDGASVPWDGALGQIGKLVLGGNRTMAAPTNLVAEAFYVARISQDATGGRSLAWNSIFKFARGVAPTLTTTANALDTFTFQYDGTNLVEFGRNQDVK
jgi:hypothetical protein